MEDEMGGMVIDLIDFVTVISVSKAIKMKLIYVEK